MAYLKTYRGNVEITKDNQAFWEKKLKKVTKITGDLIIYSPIGEDMERQLWEHNSDKKWLVSERCSEWLLSQDGKFRYFINQVEFDRTLFNAVRQDILSACEVFQIKNIEHRRVAYERLDKAKVADLPDLKTLDETTDAYGHLMRIIAFKADGVRQPFRFLHCTCPSTGREYYLETDQKECVAAKHKSFGLAEDVNFIEEW